MIKVQWGARRGLWVAHLTAFILWAIKLKTATEPMKRTAL